MGRVLARAGEAHALLRQNRIRLSKGSPRRTDVMNAHKHLLVGKGISHGKGAIRYSKPERIDFNVVESMLRATQESMGPVC